MPGFSLSLTLGAGLQIDRGRPPLKQRCELLWGRSEYGRVQQSVWDLTQVRHWSHRLLWSLHYANRIDWGYRLRLESARQFAYGELRQHRLHTLWAYADARQYRLTLRITYRDQPMYRCALRLPYASWGYSRIAMQWRYAACRSHRRTHRLVYADKPSHQSFVQWHYAATRGLRGRSQWPYAHRAIIRLQQRWHYAHPLSHRLLSRWPYADARRLRVSWVMPSTGLVRVRANMRTPYGLMAANRRLHRLAYDITQHQRVRSRCLTGWALLQDGRLQAVANTPELVWRGQTIALHQARLSCDEDSPFWLAEIELADRGDFAAMAIGDAFTLSLGLETFVLVIDGKTLSRQENAEQHYQITAVSPLALLDAPFSGITRFYQAEAISARMAVEHLIGTVDWQLPDWTIPAGRLLLDGVTPLAGARTIVAAIGGIVENHPDGSVVCRRRHPISVPDYASATVAHSLFDSEVMSSRTQIAPAKGFDRVTIANEEASNNAASDRIECVVDPEDSHRGLVRAYLATTRPVILTHTGHPDTLITALGPTVRTETETIEFIEGRASSQYPVTTILSALWQHSDLGTVSASQQALRVDNTGYSLLKLSYTTTSLDWQVSLITDEDVQFVLVDV